MRIAHLEIVGNDGALQGGGGFANDGVAVFGGADIIDWNGMVRGADGTWDRGAAEFDATARA